MVNEVIILAGGKSLRLWPVTKDIPKCLVKIKGKTLLEYQLDWLHRYDVKKIIVSIPKRFLGTMLTKFGKSLIYSCEDTPLGTAGGVKKALEHVSRDEFFVINCDEITNVDLFEFAKLGAPALCVAPFRSPFGIVELSEENVANFKQKPLLPYWASIGVYLLHRRINFCPSGSLEQDVFPNLKLKAYKHSGFWMTVNTLKDIEELENFFELRHVQDWR